jgi:hypothetical protein
MANERKRTPSTIAFAADSTKHLESKTKTRSELPLKEDTI